MATRAQALSRRRGAEFQLVAAPLVNVTAQARCSVALRWADRVEALAKLQLDCVVGARTHAVLCMQGLCDYAMQGAPRPRREPRKRFGRRLTWHRTLTRPSTLFTTYAPGKWDNTPCAAFSQLSFPWTATTLARMHARLTHEASRANLTSTHKHSVRF